MWILKISFTRLRSMGCGVTLCQAEGGGARPRAAGGETRAFSRSFACRQRRARLPLRAATRRRARPCQWLAGEEGTSRRGGRRALRGDSEAAGASRTRARVPRALFSARLRARSSRFVDAQCRRPLQDSWPVSRPSRSRARPGRLDLICRDRGTRSPRRGRPVRRVSRPSPRPFPGLRRAEVARSPRVRARGGRSCPAWAEACL